MFNRYALVTVLAAVVCFPLPGKAQRCTALSLVGGPGTEVTKTVTIPTLGIISRTNWNTDWIVPSNKYFQSFTATIVPKTNGSFYIKMYLKYADQTTDEFYNTKDVPLKAGEPFTIKATPRPQTQPYQVNMFIGGTSAVDKTYTARVVGCN